MSPENDRDDFAEPVDLVAVESIYAEDQYELALKRLLSHRAALAQSAEDLEQHIKDIPKRTIGEYPYVYIGAAFLLGWWLAR